MIIVLGVVIISVVLQTIILMKLYRRNNSMSTLSDIATKVTELQTSQIAEASRQDAKNATLTIAIATVNATLATVQAELDALKAGGQTPENQILIDKAVSDIAGVVAALNAQAI